MCDVSSLLRHDMIDKSGEVLNDVYSLWDNISDTEEPCLTLGLGLKPWM